MRTVLHALAITAAVLAAQSALGQARAQAAPPAAGVTTEETSKPEPRSAIDRARINELERRLAELAQPKPQRFDLNFPGGGPKALVAAIEKATGKRLNAIVQGQEGDVYIPEMKLTNVTVRDVFGALTLASGEKDSLGTNSSPPHYCFQTTGQGEDAVWCFHVDPPQFSNVCRYFQLAEYLDNFTIEDITTAIQTGWELLGVKPTPRLKFHPETKLLIAVGQHEELQTIEDVLSQLRRALPNPGRPAARFPGMPRPIPAPTPKKDGGSNN